MEEKSYVGLDCCIYCGEPKGILIDRRLKPSLEKCQATDTEPCDECKAQMAKGFTFIVMNNDHTAPLGKFIVIDIDKAREMIDKEFMDQCKENIALVDEKTIKELGFIK